VCNNFASECLDYSDHRLCPGSVCGDKADYFGCRDEKFCIWDHLLCDGHVQCDDGSDEEFCSVCPRVNSTRGLSRTYSCEHRYTGRPICANPCDGLDDLCKDYSDEDCEGGSFLVIITLAGAATIFLSSIAMLAKKFCNFGSKRDHTFATQISIELLSFDAERKDDISDNYMNMREDANFSNRLTNLLLYFKFFGLHQKAAKISKHFHEMEMKWNQSDTDSTNDYYFHQFGTNTSTDFFFDILANSLGIRIKKFFASICPAFIEVIAANIYVKMTTLYFMFLGKVLVHYADIIKDFLLVFKIWNYMLGGNRDAFFEKMTTFPAVVLWILLASIVASEIMLLISLTNSEMFGNLNKIEKATSIFLCPFMPAVVHYKELKAKVKQLKALYKVNWDENDQSLQAVDACLTESQLEIHALQSVRADFRAGENAVEHFVQLVVLLLILLLQRTNTANVVRLDKIFLNNNDIFIYLSLSWSFVSLLRGHLSYIAIAKNEFLPLTGKLILFGYFAIGLSGKLFIIVLFCTPSLGLFDTNFHGQLGSLNIKKKMYLDHVEVSRVFDYHINDTPIFVEDIWPKLQLSNSELFHLPTSIYPSMLVMFILYLVIGYILQSRLHSCSKKKPLKIIFLSLYSLLCPPLFLDWEVIYHKNAQMLTVKESWRKSQVFLICNIVLHFVGHIMLCIPLMMLNCAISKRNAELAELFPPLKDELYSTFTVDVLLSVGVVVALALPPVQYGLAHLYFVKGHPWSRILNARMSSVKSQPTNDIST
jgi:hypothetical protein